MDHLGNALVRPLLITGARGYLGRKIRANLIQRGIKATCISRSNPDLTKSRDVRAVIPSGAIIIHCAAVVPKSVVEYMSVDAANMSFRMVENLLDQQPYHFVFASSMTVYGERGHDVHEEEASDNLKGYAAGKRRAEQIIETSGVGATILRLPGLFGPPRHDGFLYNSIRRLVKGDPIQLPANPPLWAPLHVDDAAEMIVRAILQIEAPTHQIINIGYDHVFSLSRVLSELSILLNQVGQSQSNLGPEFSMNLARMRAILGELPRNWDYRIQEIVKFAKQDKC